MSRAPETVSLDEFRAVGPVPSPGDSGLAPGQGTRPTVKQHSFVAALPRRAGLVLIRGYQFLISPLLVAISGPGSGCRFHPTCSHYAAGAVEKHGLIAGTWLAARRLAKCHPWHPGGVDLVPEKSPFTFRKSRHDRPPFRGAVHPHG